MYYYYGCMLFVGLRGDVPTFHGSSLKTNRGPAAGWLVYWFLPGLKAVLCSFVEKLTPQHVALEIWSQASRVRASQMPNAMLTKGQHWQNVLLWICSEDVFQTMNRIQYDSDVSPPGGSIVHLHSFCTTMCDAHVSVASVMLRGEIMLKTLKVFWWCRTNAYGTREETSADSAWRLCLPWLIAGMTAWTPPSIRYDTPLQSCLQRLKLREFFTQQHSCLRTLNHVFVDHLKKKQNNIYFHFSPFSRHLSHLQ